jgi:hypothetical protein
MFPPNERVLMIRSARTFFATLATVAVASVGLSVATDRAVSDGAVVGTVTLPQQDGQRAKVLGCNTEDSCTIDYRGRSNGPGGVWVIRQTTP